MHDNFKLELWRLLILMLLITLIGSLSGYWFATVMLGFGGYISWHLYQVYHLERWLHGVDESVLDDLSGIWRYAAERMHRARQQDRYSKKKLSRLVQRLHRTLEAMPDAAVVLEKNLEVEWFNAAAQKLLGLSSTSKNKKISKLIKNKRLNNYLKKKDFEQTLEIQSPVSPALELEVNMVHFGEDLYLLTAHDITQIKRVEAVRRDFIANVSHELRTPLTVITGYLELLQSEALPDHVTQAVLASNRQAERMQRIVADLLMLSRLELEEEGAEEEVAAPVMVDRLLEGLAEDARRLSGDKNHRIRLHLDPSLQLLGSETELGSAFGNLLFNAVLHTSPGTGIDVFWGREDEGARLVVADQGPGIKETHLQRLTERFYRVDKGRSREKGGTGLGLSIVKHVLNRHGGRMEIESEPGSGSRFVCLFPPERVMVYGRNQRQGAGPSGVS